MNDIESAFSDLGVNAIIGVQILGDLDISTDELVIPQRFAKLQSVIKYLSQFPGDTQRFLLNKATRGKIVDKLDHMFEYTVILREKEQYEKEMEMTNKELVALGITDDFGKLTELQSKKEDIGVKLNRLGEELEVFNK